MYALKMYEFSKKDLFITYCLGRPKIPNDECRYQDLYGLYTGVFIGTFLSLVIDFPFNYFRDVRGVLWNK